MAGYPDATVSGYDGRGARWIGILMDHPEVAYRLLDAIEDVRQFGFDQGYDFAQEERREGIVPTD